MLETSHEMGDNANMSMSVTIGSLSEFPYVRGLFALVFVNGSRGRPSPRKAPIC